MEFRDGCREEQESNVQADPLLYVHMSNLKKAFEYSGLSRWVSLLKDVAKLKNDKNSGETKATTKKKTLFWH